MKTMIVSLSLLFASAGWAQDIYLPVGSAIQIGQTKVVAGDLVNQMPPTCDVREESNGYSVYIGPERKLQGRSYEVAVGTARSYQSQGKCR